MISSRPIIKEKLVWVPPPIKYHNIRKEKGIIKEHNKIRNNKLIDNVKNNEFKKRINDLDNKYTGNNIVFDKDFNKDFEKIKKHNDKNKDKHANNHFSNPEKEKILEKDEKNYDNNMLSNNEKNNEKKYNPSSKSEHFTRKSLNKPKIEHFDSYGYGSMLQNPKKNCPKFNMTQCLKFQNCGYITTYDFNNRCVPGDPHGPLDKKIKYQKYYHNDPFTRALIANDNHYRDMSEDVFDIE